MADVLTDADIERLGGPKPLTDADIERLSGTPKTMPLVPAQDTAHRDFLNFKAAHPNIKAEDIQELNTTTDHHEIDAFAKDHPYIYGALKALFNDATPQPGIMAVEGPLGAAVKAATQSGGPSAGKFVADVLQHPKTIAAMKDAAIEWLKEIPGVKGSIKTAKAVSSIKDVVDDVRAAQILAEVPTKAAPPAPIPVRPPLAPKPLTTVPAETAAPIRPPLSPLPEPTDVGIHGGVENTPQPDSGLTEAINKLKRDWAIKMGDDPNLPFGEMKGGRYQAKFDEGSKAPVVQSELRKPQSTAEPANPMRIAKDIGEKLAGRITTEQFDSMSNNPKALAVITRQYGVEPDVALIAAIRRRIAAKSSEVTSPQTINISDLMKR